MGGVREVGDGAELELGGRGMTEAGRFRLASWSWVCALQGLHTRIGSLACDWSKSPVLGLPCSDFSDLGETSSCYPICTWEGLE